MYITQQNSAGDKAMDSITKRKNFIIDVVYFVLLIGLFYLFFKYAFGICLPFIFAVFIATVLQKPVNAIVEKTKGRFRGFISALLAIFCFVILGSLAVLLIVRLVTELKSFWDFIMLKLENTELFITQVSEWINTRLVRLPESLRTSLSGYVENLLVSLLGNAEETAEVTVEKTQSFDLSVLASPLSAVWGTAKQIPMVAVGLLVAIVSCCFLTADYKSFKELIIRLAGEQNSVKLIAAKRILFSTVAKVGKAYLILICITFTEMLLGLGALKLFGLYKGGYVFAISLITALVDIFPVLGTGTILIPWGVYSLVTGNIGFGIGILVLYVVITVIRQAVEPKLVADQLGLPAYVTIVAMYIGTQLFGFIGLFLLPISIMLIKVLNDEGIISIFRRGEISVDKLNAEVEDKLHRHEKQEDGK